MRSADTEAYLLHRSPTFCRVKNDFKTSFDLQITHLLWLISLLIELHQICFDGQVAAMAKSNEKRSISWCEACCHWTMEWRHVQWSSKLCHHVWLASKRDLGWQLPFCIISSVKFDEEDIMGRSVMCGEVHERGGTDSTGIGYKTQNKNYISVLTLIQLFVVFFWLFLVFSMHRRREPAAHCAWSSANISVSTVHSRVLLHICEANFCTMCLSKGIIQGWK